jgi:two-component system, OmpR family, sensor histidine kinase BaeS
VTRFGISARIAAAAVLAALIGVSILAVGVVVVGSETFTQMMVDAGDTSAHAREMYDASVTRIVLVAGLIAVVASVVLALVVGRHLGTPLHRLSSAARRVAGGDYSARVSRSGPEELASVADSFNQMAEELEAQERVRRDFIANAAHELRTPLTNLRGYLEALRDGVVAADRSAFDSLLEETNRLVRLSQSLELLAAGDATPTEAGVVELDLADAVRSAVDLFRPAAEARGLELILRQPPSTRGRGDADHLAQVLANLLTNAVRYSPHGGRVVVRVDPRPRDVLVTVSNTSEPIGPRDLNRLFERFYRVEKSRDRQRGGAGIGLAIVKQLVERAGGRVGAEHENGETRVWFTVPVGPA